MSADHPAARSAIPLLFDAATGVLSPAAALQRGEVPEALLAALAPAPLPSPAGPARGANVLLITVDSLRADRLPARAPAALPHLAALARDGFVAARAHAPSCWTIHSMTAVLSSQLPSRLRFTHVSVDTSLGFTPHDMQDELVRNPLAFRKVTPVPWHTAQPTLAGMLRGAGYQTATVVSYIFYFREAGVTRDFEWVDEDAYRALAIDGSGIAAVPMVERAARFLDGRDSERPFFPWLHFMEPHAPYQARDATAEGGSDEARYDSELRYVDGEIGKLLDMLRARALLDETLMIALADHGEELRDHGGQFHATTLFEETVHVPLVIKLPVAAAAVPAVIDAPVSLLDVTPTILDLLGVPTHTPLMGRSLWPAMREVPVPARPILSECARFGRNKRAVMVWPYKRILDETVGNLQLYQLGQDPGEQRNLADAAPAVLDSLLGLLLHRIEPPTGPAPQR